MTLKTALLYGKTTENGHTLMVMARNPGTTALGHRRGIYTIPGAFLVLLPSIVTLTDTGTATAKKLLAGTNTTKETLTKQ
jgi:hypothetical protein